MDWKKFFSRVRLVLGSILVVVLFITLIVTLVSRISGKTPEMFGISLLRISSNSMEPELMVGDIILIKDTDIMQIKEGDIISYRGEKGSYAGKVITHKVIEEPRFSEADGVYYLTTAGIREGAHADPEIEQTQVLGKLVCVVPLLGWLYNFFTTWYGFLIFVLIVLFSFSSEIINIIKILKYQDYGEDVPQEEPNDGAQSNGSEYTETENRKES
jgi:signal peptidase